MRTKILISNIYKLLIIGSVIFFISTIISYFIGKHYYILLEIDLRFERNIATWFQGTFFLFTGITFYCIFLIFKEKGPKNTLLKMFYFIAFLLFLFLSADEMTLFHEYVGMRMEQSLGFMSETTLEDRCQSCWIIVFIIPAIAFLVIYYLAIRNVYRRFTGSSKQRSFLLYSVLFIVAAGSVFLFEFLEGYITLSTGNHNEFITVIEEGVELTCLAFLYKSNMIVINEYDQ